MLQNTKPPATTPSFKDSSENHREWFLRLNVGVARRISAEIGVDVGAVADGKVFIELIDREKLAGTLWLICEHQAERAGISPEQFAELLDGDTIDAALESLEAAIVLFSPSRQRRAVQALAAKTKSAVLKTTEAAATWIEQNADPATDDAIRKATADLPTFGNASPPSRAD